MNRWSSLSKIHMLDIFENPWRLNQNRSDNIQAFSSKSLIVPKNFEKKPEMYLKTLTLYLRALMR